MIAGVIDIVIKSALLLAAAGIVTLLLRRRPAAMQAAALTAALAGLLVLPAAAVWLPAWPVSIAVPFEIGAGAPDRRSVAATSTTAATRVLPAAAAAPRPSRDLLVIDGGDARPATSLPRFAAVPWTAFAIGSWVSVAMLLTVRLAVSHMHLRRLVRRAPAEDGAEWRALVDDATRALGIRRRIAVRVSADLGVPVVAGLISPVLLIPEESREWPPALRSDVVRHELAHVARWDAIGQLTGQLACVLHWFNPLVWRTAARASMLRERACDDAVLRAGTRASDYAARLLDLARAHSDRAPGIAALAMARPSRMRDRITGVLDPAARRDALGGRTRVALAGAAAIAVVGIGAIDPTVRAMSEVPAALDAGGGAGISESAPAPQTADRICAGEMRNSSQSISDDDGNRRWRIRLQGTECDLDLRAEGTLEFNDDFTDVARIGRGGFLDIDITSGGVRRELDIRSGAGGLTRTYRVDGRERPWDADAQRWFADFLIALDRRTAIGIDQRFPRLLKQGVGAVLAETALMPSDYARYTYQARLLDEAQLTVDQRRQVLEQAARLTDSDYYGSELLKRVVRQGRMEDARERAVVVSMIEQFDSDYYRSEAISTLAGGAFTDAQRTALLKVVGGMGSDYYKTETLKKVLPAGALDATQRGLVADVLAGLDSDYYIAETLERLAERGALTPADILSAATRVESDHYRGEIVAVLLQGGSVREADLLAVVAAIGEMDSDHYKSEALQRVLRNGGVTDRVRAAVDRAAEQLSSSYRRRIRR